MYGLHGKVQRNSDDVIIIITDEEEKFRQKFFTNYEYISVCKCTICDEVINDKVFPHPALKVVVCSKCYCNYEKAVFSSHKDGTDINCRWCSEPAEEFCCSFCTAIFCKECLLRNFGRDFVQNKVDTQENWPCLICDTKQLWRLRAICAGAYADNNSSQRSCSSTYSDSFVGKTGKEEAEIFLEEVNSRNSEDKENEEPLGRKNIINDDQQIKNKIMNKNSNIYSDDESSSEESLENLSPDAKEAGLEVLEESMANFEKFILLFTDGVQRFRDRFQVKNIRCNKDVENFVDKISQFCSLVKGNMDKYDNENRAAFQKWRENYISNKTLQNGDSLNCDNIPNSPGSETPSTVDLNHSEISSNHPAQENLTLKPGGKIVKTPSICDTFAVSNTKRRVDLSSSKNVAQENITKIRVTTEDSSDSFSFFPKSGISNADSNKSEVRKNLALQSAAKETSTENSSPFLNNRKNEVNSNKSEIDASNHNLGVKSTKSHNISESSSVNLNKNAPDSNRDQVGAKSRPEQKHNLTSQRGPKSTKNSDTKIQPREEFNHISHDLQSGSENSLDSFNIFLDNIKNELSHQTSSDKHCISKKLKVTLIDVVKYPGSVSGEFRTPSRNALTHGGCESESVRSENGLNNITGAQSCGEIKEEVRSDCSQDVPLAESGEPIRLQSSQIATECKNLAPLQGVEEAREEVEPPLKAPLKAPLKEETTSSQRSGDTTVQGSFVWQEVKTDPDFDRDTLPMSTNLGSRLLEDFPEEDENPAHHLCEKTGFLSKFYSGGEDCSSIQISKDDVFEDKSRTDFCDLLTENVSLIFSNNRPKNERDASAINQSVFAEILEAKSHDIGPEKPDSETESDSGAKTELINNAETGSGEGRMQVSEVITESDSSYVRNLAYQSLMDTDEGDTNWSFESDTTSGRSNATSKNTNSVLEPGYITSLNIAAEMQKLKSKCESSSTEEDFLGDVTKNDPKLRQSCYVKIHRTDFDNLYGITKKQDENGFRIIDADEDEISREHCYVKLHRIDFNNGIKKKQEANGFRIIDSEEDQINRLTNLNFFKRRRKCSSSSSSGTESKYCEKKSKKHSRENSKDDEFSDSTDDFHSSDSLKSGRNSKLKLADDYKENIFRELNNGITDDDDDFDHNDNLNRKKKREKRANKDASKKNDTSKEEDGKSSWRRDKLLLGSVNLTDSDVTNDSEANAILKNLEENSLFLTEESDNKSSSDASETKKKNEPIILSDCDPESSDTDSDCLFIAVKRKRDSDVEEVVPVKKGRRNIREVLNDDELQEETQRADKEEAERKERISKKHQSLETALSQGSQEELGLVLDIDEETKTPLISVHPQLMPPLAKHQVIGIKFMWDVCFESVAELRRSKGAGCILAHCMGLGKTRQIVVLTHTLLSHSATQVKHVLVVCPLSTVFNWVKEYRDTLQDVPDQLKLFNIRPDRQRQLKQKVMEIVQWRRRGGVLILSYDTFRSLVREDKKGYAESDRQAMTQALVDPGPDLVVCDEGHMLKSGKTSRFKLLSGICTLRRIILTGTPLQNNLTEYYHMVSFVKPHLLGTYKEFSNRFVNPIYNGQYEDSGPADINLMRKRSHVLHKKLETTVQRFEESELKKYLPEKHDHVLFVKLTPLQIELYKHYLALPENKKLFQNFHELQHIWTHPALLQMKFNRKKDRKKVKTYEEYFEEALDPDRILEEVCKTDWFRELMPDDVMTNVEYGSKMMMLLSIVKESIEMGSKLLVFSTFIIELDLMEIFLQTLVNPNGQNWVKGVDYFRMDGQVIPEERVKLCDSFNDPRNTYTKVFLVSHKVGGLGLNLVAANRVVLMDVSWNPAYDLQSVFRLYRFGQKQPCYIYRLVSFGTMEEVVYGRSVTKLAISCRVVDEQQISRHFKSDDLQRMYQLNLDYSNERQTANLPSDRLLAKLALHCPMLLKFEDHQSLLENLPHEELNEEEMKLAWEEFRKEEEIDRRQREASKNIARLSDAALVSGQQEMIYYPLGGSLVQAVRKNIQGNRKLQQTPEGAPLQENPEPQPSTSKTTFHPFPGMYANPFSTPATNNSAPEQRTTSSSAVNSDAQPHPTTYLQSYNIFTNSLSHSTPLPKPPDANSVRPNFYHIQTFRRNRMPLDNRRGALAGRNPNIFPRAHSKVNNNASVAAGLNLAANPSGNLNASTAGNRLITFSLNLCLR